MFPSKQLLFLLFILSGVLDGSNVNTLSDEQPSYLVLVDYQYYTL